MALLQRTTAAAQIVTEMRWSTNAECEASIACQPCTPKRNVARMTAYLAVVSLLVLVGACSTTPPAPPTAVVPMEVLNPNVRPETIDQTICVAGYTASVRPATSYTNGVKIKLLRESGVEAANASKYELDHIIPLAVGGHPRNLKNLILQSWDGEDGAKKKDRLEKRLQQLVCSKQLGLRDAQAAIYGDWQNTYRRYVKRR